MKKDNFSITSNFSLPTYYGYFCQRYYDPQISRFITLDPVDDKKVTSPYAYCSNDPLKFTDPTGETSMAAEWVKWQMEDDAFFFGTMGGNGFIPYTGWAPKNWFLGSSAELDPDFWAKGWDWGNLSSYDLLIRQAMFLLSSGIFEWDVLTANGWEYINIGEWIKAQGIEITNLWKPSLFGTIEGAPNTVDFFHIMINTDKIKQTAGKSNVWDVMEVITHEAVHQFAARLGWLNINQEQIAFLTGFMFQRNMSYYMRNEWALMAWYSITHLGLNQTNLNLHQYRSRSYPRPQEVQNKTKKCKKTL